MWFTFLCGSFVWTYYKHSAYCMYLHVLKCACACACSGASVYIGAGVYEHVPMWACVWVCVCTCESVCAVSMCVCMWVCVSVRACLPVLHSSACVSRSLSISLIPAWLRGSTTGGRDLPPSAFTLLLKLNRLARHVWSLAERPFISASSTNP